jgi:hypothetical protein
MSAASEAQRRLEVVRRRAVALAAHVDPAELPSEQVLRQDPFRGCWGWSGQHCDQPHVHTAGQVEVDTWDDVVAFVAARMSPYREITMVQRPWPNRILTFQPDGSVVVVSGPAPWEKVRHDDFATATEALIAYHWPSDTPRRWRQPLTDEAAGGWRPWADRVAHHAEQVAGGVTAGRWYLAADMLEQLAKDIAARQQVVARLAETVAEAGAEDDAEDDDGAAATS